MPAHTATVSQPMVATIAKPSIGVTKELEDRFRQAARDYAPLVSRIAASYEKRPEIVEELTQEIFLSLWRALPNYRGEASLKTFLARIAHNVCVSHVRVDAKTSMVELSPERADSAPTPEATADTSMMRSKLFDAVRELPLSSRQVISLHLEGFSNREIGEALDLSEGNVAVRITRARKTLTEMVGN